MIVESVRKGQTHVSHASNELLFLDSERDILDDNSSGDQLVVVVLGRRSALLSKLVHIELAVHLIIVHVLGLVHLRVKPSLNKIISSAPAISIQQPTVGRPALRGGCGFIRPVPPITFAPVFPPP